MADKIKLAEIRSAFMQNKENLAAAVTAAAPGTSPVKTPTTHECTIVEEKVITRVGSIAVHIFGDRKKPAIVTYHDLGLNALSCFQNFFEFGEMATLAQRFCIYHVNAPGQEENADSFPENYVYPSLDELAETVALVVHHFCIKNFIGFGVGAGANVLCRYALKHPKVLDGLILVNCSGSTTGWIEWGYQKANVFYLRNRGMTSFTVDYLMWHNFGRNFENYDPNLIASYREYFSKLPNPKNLAGFIDSYIRRSALGLRRQGGSTLSCPVLQIVGAGSPHVNETIDLNKRLDPSNSNWLKISECSGLVLEEAPEKVTEAILLFLQGIGLLPSVSHLKLRERRPSYQQRSMSVCAPMMTHSVAAAVTGAGSPGGGSLPPYVYSKRSHSIATPGAGHLGDEAVLRLFDKYHARQQGRGCLETTREETSSNASLNEDGESGGGGKNAGSARRQQDPPPAPRIDPSQGPTPDKKELINDAIAITG